MKDYKGISYADLKKSYDKAFQIACDDHQPEASLDTNEDGTCVVVHCKNCGFTAWVHPETYREMLACKR